MREKSDLEQLALQERILELSSFDLDIAWSLGQSIRDSALQRGVALVIEVRIAKETVFFCAMNGTSPNNTDWVRRKRNTVELMQKSSYSVGLALADEGTTLQEKSGLNLCDYASHGGGFPLRVKGVGCIGSVTVSGVPQREDHGFVVEALATICKVPIDEVSLTR